MLNNFVMLQKSTNFATREITNIRILTLFYLFTINYGNKNCWSRFAPE